MIECIFTVDYEIYGNGEGSLKELIYDPAARFLKTFRKWNAPFVVFVEAAELEMIDANGTDPAIESVKSQIREFFHSGIELALHLHPQWYNARFEHGKWILDYSEYSLCGLPQERIRHIVHRSLEYLRTVVDDPNFTPVSFRAGNWLFQPTRAVAEVLIENGIRIDSSVFKGGRQRNHGLDYRASMKNGYFWPFQNDVNVVDINGALIEIPTYSAMVPFWKMLTSKRVGLQRKGYSTAIGPGRKLNRYLDLLRLWYPLKFDFCRMTLKELIHMVDDAICQDRRNPESLKPMVAIGHTKDLVDFETIERFLDYLKEKQIPVARLDSMLERTGLAPGSHYRPSTSAKSHEPIGRVAQHQNP